MDFILFSLRVNTPRLAASSHPGHRSGIQQSLVLDSGLRRNDDRYPVACHGVVHFYSKLFWNSGIISKLGHENGSYEQGWSMYSCIRHFSRIGLV